MVVINRFLSTFQCIVSAANFALVTEQSFLILVCLETVHCTIITQLLLNFPLSNWGGTAVKEGRPKQGTGREQWQMERNFEERIFGIPFGQGSLFNGLVLHSNP